MLILPDGSKEYYDCESDACKKYNSSTGSFFRVARGERKQHKNIKGVIILE